MDDGPGVPPEHVGRLFEAFFTTKPAADGTGLGLSVSYGIVAAHGGELRYGPTAWGRGAAFTFDLPVRAGDGHRHRRRRRPRTRRTPPRAAGSRRERRRRRLRAAAVLVLDDEPSLRIFLGRALRAFGHEAIIAASGEEAIALRRDEPYARHPVRPPDARDVRRRRVRGAGARRPGPGPAVRDDERRHARCRPRRRSPPARGVGAGQAVRPGHARADRSRRTARADSPAQRSAAG